MCVSIFTDHEWKEVWTGYLTHYMVYKVAKKVDADDSKIVQTAEQQFYTWKQWPAGQ